MHLRALAAFLIYGIAPWIADQNLRHLGLQQIVEPSRPGPFFPSDMQFTPQTVDKLQNAAGLGFDNGLHHQLATAIEDGDYNRFLVHVHADILDVANHSVASLGDRSFASTKSFPQGKVSFFSRLAYLLLWFLPTSPVYSSDR